MQLFPDLLIYANILVDIGALVALVSD
jgi:hypothetical protein